MKISVRILLAMICLAASTTLLAQETARPPQNARQALLDMFFGKAGSMERHLPEATRKAIREASDGGPNFMQQISMASAAMNAPDTRIQKFETGSTLLSVENTKTFTKFEAIVDKDDLSGDEDNIQVSFQMYNNGKIEKNPVLPAMNFLMKQEKNVWRLSEISLTIRVALADPDLLKLMVEGSKARRLTTISAVSQENGNGNGNGGFGDSTAPSTPIPHADETSAIAAMRSILAAEKIYSSTYHYVGFTCQLSDLDGFGQGTPNEHQAMLIESRLASGKKRGYLFAISGCGTTPNQHFQLTARPADNAPGRTFCADETTTIHTSADPATCQSQGALLP